MANLHLRSLSKNYGDTRVLEGVDLEVEDGEYLVLVGPSGCGKSTLLRCIAGLEEITAGELQIGERVVNDLAPRERNVAMVFQSYALYPHMTVAENLAFPLRIQKADEATIAQAVDEAARMLDIVALLDRKPSQLSGGQRQRVAMGRAVVREPDVFLFDEPLSNLDASLRSHMRVELKRLHRRLGTTVVHVTHDQVEALTLADRILVLHEGVVQQVGSPRELFNTPANTFVATFIGSPSMNLLPAIGEGTESRLDGVEGHTTVPGNGPYTLGVRPTDITLGEGGLLATVDVVESLGADALVHLQLGPHRVTAQVPEPLSVKVGDKTGLRFSTVHRFEVESGSRLP